MLIVATSLSTSTTSYPSIAWNHECLAAFVLWPGFIPDSESWALELRAIDKELKAGVSDIIARISYLVFSHYLANIVYR